MPINVEAIPASDALYYRFSGQITHNDLDSAQNAEASCFARLGDDQRITVIADMSGLHTISAELFPRLQSLHMVSDRRVCRVIVVGANPYLRALALSLGSFDSPHHFIFRPTLADALQSIEQNASV
ncbi:MAG: hypothetical protein KJ047_12835 [Anaerolineae bacterium]|nr:hypothetical protein [Anaerolineae bacterium]